jgi:putative membrane protein
MSDRDDPGARESAGEARPSAEGGDSRTELAEDRTDWAMERTLLAKQRTFGAWLRTGLASVAVGFGAAELLGDLEPQWLVKAAAAMLIVAGATIFAIGFLSYGDTFRKLRNEGIQGFSPWIIGAVTFAMLVGAALLLLTVLSE